MTVTAAGASAIRCLVLLTLVTCTFIRSSRLRLARSFPVAEGNLSGNSSDVEASPEFGAAVSVPLAIGRVDGCPVSAALAHDPPALPSRTQMETIDRACFRQIMGGSFRYV